MKKKDLISKWLDHELTADELKAFEKSDAFGSLSRIDEAAKRFEAPELDIDLSYQKLLAQREQSKPAAVGNNWLRIVSRVAAVAVIGIGLYWVIATNGSEQRFVTAMGEKTELLLPDQTEVLLNAGSSLSYDESEWSSNRMVNLEGEGLFDVTTGSSFTVHTSSGDVTVLGTRFNVKNRENWFEVSCFEGLVEVQFGTSKYKLAAGNSFRLINGQPQWEEMGMTNPSWINNKSVFKSVPYKSVIEELERQYGVNIEASTIDKSVIFTGSFTHEDLETALKAISIPLSLTYEVSESNVTLK